MIEIMFIIHYLTYLFLFLIALTEKNKSISATEDDFYRKVIEAKCTEAAARRCIKKVFLEFLQIHRKAPVPETLFQ